MTTTPFLGLDIYTIASGSLTKVVDWRNAIAGTNSNMTDIDTWASGISGSVTGLLSSYGISPVSASLVSTGSFSSYYEASSNSIVNYADGMMMEFIPNSTNSGSVTLNINGLGVRSLYKVNSDGTQSYMQAGDLVSYRGYLYRYSSVNNAWLADMVLVGYNQAGHLIKVGSGSTVVRPVLNFIAGSGVSVTYFDNVTGSAIDLTINSNGHTIINSSGSAFVQRQNLKFVGATVSDSSGSTIVTITGGSSVSGSSPYYLSSGITGSQINITDNNNGTATFTGGSVLLYDNPYFLGNVSKYYVSGSTFTFTDGAEEYVAIKYNSGSPYMYKETNINNLNYSDTVAVLTCWRVGNTVHSLNLDSTGDGLSNKQQTTDYRTDLYRIDYNGGMLISESITPNPRTVVVTGATVYAANIPQTVGAFNSSTDTMTLVYHSSGSWLYTNELVYNNTQYDDGTNLQSIPLNKWAVRWFYRSIGDVKQVFYVLGDATYNKQADAESLSIPRTDLPPVIKRHCILIGRSTIQLNATSGNMEYLASAPLAGQATISHNDTTNIQGGDSGSSQYYHLNLSDYTMATSSGSITKEPTGFLYPESVIISYDSTARTISISGSTTAYWQGKPISALSGSYVSGSHTNSAGVYYFYYDSGSFVWSTSPWSFDKLQIAYVSYSADNKYGMRECHGIMQWQTHKELHDTIGTYKNSGGDITGVNFGSTTATDRRPVVSATSIYDEDMLTTLSSLTSGSYTKYFLSGSSINSGSFIVETAEIVPLSGNNPYYNSYTAPNWGQTLMANNSYMSVWLVAMPMASDTTSQKYRYLWIQGQSNGNLSSQQALSPASLNLGGLSARSPEFVFLAQFILQYTGGNWNINSIVNLTGNKLNQVGSAGGTYLTGVTTSGSNLIGTGTPTSPLGLYIQGNLNEIPVLSTGGSGLQSSGSSVAQIVARTRDILSADRTYYVNPTTGSDTYSGLSSGSAFATIQKAMNVVGTLDIGLYNVTIQLADGTYAENVVAKPCVGAGTITLKGNSVTPANVNIAKSTGTLIQVSYCPQNWVIRDLKLSGSIVGSTTGIIVSGGNTQVGIANIVFNGNFIDINAAVGGQVNVIGDYSITAGMNCHWLAGTSAVINASNKAISISGSPAIGSVFVLCQMLGVINTYNCTFGYMTGTRYIVTTNGIIWTNGGGAAYFAGTVAGSTGTGGQYV